MTKIISIITENLKNIPINFRFKPNRIVLILISFIMGNIFGLQSNLLQNFFTQFIKNLYNYNDNLLEKAPILYVCLVCLFLEGITYLNFLIDKEHFNFVVQGSRRGFLLGIFLDTFKLGS